jgi:hypothetical protein
MPVVSDFSLTFFGAATSLMMSLGREGRSLVPRSEELRDMFSYTSGGTANVDLDLYDAIVIYGMGLSSWISSGYAAATELRTTSNLVP